MKDNELTEIEKKVTKRKRPDLSEKQSVHTKPGDNRKYILQSLRLAELPKVNLTNVEEVTQRITDYFTICADDDMKPSVAGLALAMDIDKGYLWEIRTGRKGKNPEVADTLKKAMKILDLQMVDYMQNGQINPVSGIFLMKNNFGYADKQEVVVTPQSPLGEAKDTKELEDRYIDSVVVDADNPENSHN
jgi:hypothetical protein